MFDLNRYQPDRMRTLWEIPAFGGELDLYETDTSIVVQVSMPGVRPDQITIQEQQGVLTLRVEQADEQRDERSSRTIHARRVHIWERSVRLPDAVESERAEARLRDGMLTITLPKAQSSAVRHIPIGGVQGSARGGAQRPQLLERLGRWLHWSRPETPAKA
jgi:HSP20 family protein